MECFKESFPAEIDDWNETTAPILFVTRRIREFAKRDLALVRMVNAVTVKSWSPSDMLEAEIKRKLFNGSVRLGDYTMERIDAENKSHMALANRIVLMLEDCINPVRPCSKNNFVKCNESVQRAIVLAAEIFIRLEKDVTMETVQQVDDATILD
jgi:hypothetical protein